MDFRVTFDDIFFDCESEEQAMDALLEYLYQVVKYEDITAFNFERNDVPADTVDSEIHANTK